MNFGFTVYLFFIISAAMTFVTVNCSPVYEDSETAASGDHHHGRVQIKVYRGPSEDKHFAPWGYWVKQPHDDHHHH